MSLLLAGWIILQLISLPDRQNGGGLEVTPLTITSDTLPAWRRHTIDRDGSGADGTKLADYNGDGRKDIVTGWEESGWTKLYIHPGYSLAGNLWPKVIVGPAPSVEDAVFADMDQDGRLDIISCTEGKTKQILIHRHTSGDWQDQGNWTTELLPASDGLMQWMYAEPLQVDKKNGVDLIAAGKGPDAALGWFEAPADPSDLKAWRWHPICPVGWIMSLILQDLDQDGDQDIIISDRKGPLQACRWLENPGPGPDQTKPWKNHWIGARGLEVMFMDLADLDGDGRTEAVVCERTNNTVQIFKQPDRPGTNWMVQEFPLPALTGLAKSVTIGDLNLDGTPDLVISTNTYDRIVSGLIWLDGSYLDEVREHHFQPISEKHNAKYDKVVLEDIDNDGDPDILICEENYGPNSEGLGVIWYENPTKK